jgi:CBS domain-containing protein
MIAGQEPEAETMQMNSVRNVGNCRRQKSREIADAADPLRLLQSSKSDSAWQQKSGNPLPAACTAGLVFHVCLLQELWNLRSCCRSGKMYSIVSDLMRVRQANVLPESTSLREAAERLIVSDCDVLVTTDEAGRFTGIISESCVVRALLSGSADATDIRSIVSHHAPSTTPQAGLATVLPLFRTASVTVIPVIHESGEICGLLLRRDVIASLMRTRSMPVELNEKIDCRRAAEPADVRDFAVSEEGRLAPIVPRWSASSLAGPHFLRGAAAKHVLWPAEDRL